MQSVNGLWQWDNQVFRAINVGLHQTWLDPFFLVLSYTGLGQVQALLILLLLLGKETKRWVVPLLSAETVAGFLFADVIKHFLIHRDRPSNLAFALPQEPFYANSFPSGHASTSFAIAFMLVLLSRNGVKPWVGWVALFWAILVGLSRIYRGVHWPTDVLGGASVGMAGAGLCYWVLDRMGKLPPAPAQTVE